ncbi:hypothetical protein HELRODRAFT_162417 [Helobdella robusta]|uniref:RNA polymerase II subunit A C-terminal domain phosphatase n=1 Tax=Helobdella robusta TaxID=6412 RepID=T1ESM4_HELRO|nr:hypothetical protein HELRODRAFT_162417 [Helobdella robusta]ESN98945.1 hypothetical protein HELRODRAFT_162417 [Helobdella robusta]
MFKVIFTDKDESCITKWKVKEGGRCSSNAVLCEYKNPKSSKSLKIMSEFPGSIEKILKKENESVRYGDVLALVESCKHETVWRNMCADCGTDLNEKKTISSAFVAMEHTIPDLLVSEKSAHELGKVDERRLLKNRRLVLLVDLDQTIIHTTNDNIPPNLKDVYHFQLNHGPNNKLWWYHTKFRPYTKKFLDKISKYYELHICTFGIRPYAHAIVNLLDPDKKYFQNRILSRDECFHASLKTLNLKALFPCGDSMVCIIDDREDVWGSAPNMIRVKPYIFFQGTADINAPPELSKSSSNRRSKIAPISRKEKIIKVPILPKDEANVPDTNKNANKIVQDVKKDDDCMAEDDGVVINTKSESASNKNVDSETDVTKTNVDSKENSDKVQCSYREIVEWEDEDDYLLHLQTILLRIHEEFYKSYDAATKTDASSSGLNLKELIPLEKKKVLKGCNILFSGILPLNQSIEVSWVYVMATNFGASVQKDFAEGRNRTTHVIAAKEGTEKVRKALERGIHVVNVNWLFQCTERWERVDEALFPLSDAKNFSQKFFQVNDNLKSKDDVKVKPIQVKTNMEMLTETEKDAMLDEIDDYLNDDNEDDENDDDDKEKDDDAAKEDDDDNNNKKDNSNGASKNVNSLLGSGSKDIKEEEEDLEEKLADEKLKRKVLKCFDSRDDCSSSSDSYDNEYSNEDRLHVNKKCKFELESEGNISQIGEVSSDDSFFGNISDSDSDDVVNEDLT